MEQTNTTFLSEKTVSNILDQIEKTKEHINKLEKTEISADVFSSLFFQNFPDRNKNTIQMYLGYAFEELMRQLFTDRCVSFSKSANKSVDFFVDQFAINVKYRFGTTNGTHLQVFKRDFYNITKDGYIPLMLIYRNDNFKPLLDKAREVGWIILEGSDAKKFIKVKTKIDVDELFIDINGSPEHW